MSSDAAGVQSEAAGVRVVGDVGDPPQITLPDGPAPAGLRVIDLVEGHGAAAGDDASVTTNYTGVSWTNGGRQFDSSFDRQPLEFWLGHVIAGWREGIPGMRVGGRRLLIIPPELGYGSRSPAPEIAPNDTLVFVIDLLETD